MGRMLSILEGLNTNKFKKIKSSDRDRVNDALSTAKFGDYFKNIPMKEIRDILERSGLMLLQEDGTEWEGFLTGRTGKAMLDVGYISTRFDQNGMDAYVIIEDSALSLRWEKMDTGRYEIIAHLT